MLRTVAERRNGSFDPGGWFGNPRVEIRHGDGIEIRVSMWSTRNSRCTEYLANIPAPGLPICKVSPTSFSASVGRVFGFQDIDVGVESFDRAFMVKGDDPEVVKRLWPNARALEMVFAFASSQLECDHATIKLTRPLIEGVEQVERDLDLILDLARSDPYGLNVLGDLPEASLRHTDRFLQVELPGPSRITIGPVDQGGVVRTCARTAAMGAVPDDAETLVTAVGATLEQTEHELRLWWPGIEADPRRLTAAADVLRRLASGPQLGVFR